MDVKICIESHLEYKLFPSVSLCSSNILHNDGDKISFCFRDLLKARMPK